MNSLLILENWVGIIELTNHVGALYVDKVPKVGYQLHLFTNSGEETVFEDVNMRRFYNYLKLNFPEKNSGELDRL